MRFASKQGMQIANALHVSDNGWLCTWNESAFSGLHCEREGKVRGMHSQHHNDSFKKFQKHRFSFHYKIYFLCIFYVFFERSAVLRLGLEDVAQEEQQTLPDGCKSLQNCGLGCKTQHKRISRSPLKGVKQGPTWIVQAVPSEVQSGNGGVEEDEVSNGLGTFVLSHLAPTHLQHLNLHKPACSKSATTHEPQLMSIQQQRLMSTQQQLLQSYFCWFHTMHLMSNQEVTEVDPCDVYDCYLTEHL